jgi:alpha-mannosidase
MKRILFSAALLSLPMCSAFAEEYDTTPAPPEQAKAPAVSKVKEVIVVCKTHFDLGYTHRVKDLIPYYRTTMIDRALGIMEKSATLPKERQFAWTAPGWVMAKVLEDWQGQTPERRAKLDTAFRDGKFVVHALPFTLESDACEAEEMARGLVFASDLARKTGKPLPGAAKVTDVPGHANALATVLAQGGVKFLHIGCNWPADYVRTPGLFWWEGPDGSRTLTMYSVNYGTCTAFWPKDWIGAGPPEPQVGQGLLPPADWPYEIWPAIIVTPDNSGPPNAVAVQAYFNDAQKKMPGVKFRMGTMEEFAEAILKQNPDIPVVRAQMPDTWIHGMLSDPRGCKLSRETHPLIAAAEAQRTQLQTWGISLPSAKAQIATAYENILLYGEHTFGGAAAVNAYGENFKKFDPKVVNDLEGSWEDKTDYIRKAHTIARTLTDDNLRELARAAKRTGDCAVVYNPLPWKRDGVVAIDGQPTAVTDIPAGGYKVVPMPPVPSWKQPEPSAVPVTLENRFFKVTLDPVRGALTSLVDKRTGREWLDGADHGVGYLNERFSYQQTYDYVKVNMAERTRGSFGVGEKNSWLHPNMYKPGLPEKTPYRAASPKAGVVHRHLGDAATLVMPGDAANHLPATELRVSLPPGQAVVDIEVVIKGKARDNWPEADWLRLPFNISKPRFTVARTLGEMNPATDILPGANQDMYTVGHGLTIAGDDGAGVAICPLDHPLISLDRPGCWRFSRDFTPTKPEVFVNLYNNQWNTNFRYWHPGTWSSRVRLWTFDKETPAAARLAIPALEARNPLQVALATGNGGDLPAEQSGITVSRPGTLVTAFGENPDGTGTLLRVWEQSGVSGNLTLTLPSGFKATRAIPVDLRGEKTGASLEINDGKLTFPLKAYAPASFLVE